MNLVAKEFVCARSDDRGVLVLSRFAGAAQQLPEALIVNPHAIEGAAVALSEALCMPEAEQSRRMRKMRANVSAFDSQWWAEQLLRDAARPRLLQHRRADSSVHAYTA